MDKKAFIAVLVCALLASSLAATLANAQTTIPKPSVPEFTLTYLDNSIEVTITNQPFTPFNDPNNNLNYLFYSVSVKGHNDSNWIYHNQTYSIVNDEGVFSYISASSANTTVLAFQIGGYGPGLTIANDYVGSKVDFEVQAYYGYWTTVAVNPYLPFVNHSATSEQVITVTQTSDWSNIQTIAIPEPSPPESPSPTQTSTTITPFSSPTLTSSPVPISSSPPTEQPTLERTQSTNPTIVTSIDLLSLILSIVAVTIAVAIAIFLVVYFRRTKKQK